MTNTNVDLTMISNRNLKKFANEIFANIPNAEEVVSNYIKWGIIDVLDDDGFLLVCNINNIYRKRISDGKIDEVPVGKHKRHVLFMHNVLKIFKDKSKACVLIKQALNDSEIADRYMPFGEEFNNKMIARIENNKHHKSRYNSDNFKRAIIANIFISDKILSSEMNNNIQLNFLKFKHSPCDIDLMSILVDIIFAHDISITDKSFDMKLFTKLIARIPIGNMCITGLGPHGVANRFSESIDLAIKLSLYKKNNAQDLAESSNRISLFKTHLTYGIGYGVSFKSDSKDVMSFLLQKRMHAKESTSDELVTRITNSFNELTEVQYLQIIDFLKRLSAAGFVLGSDKSKLVIDSIVRDSDYEKLFYEKMFDNLKIYLICGCKHIDTIQAHIYLYLLRIVSDEYSEMLKDMPDDYTDKLTVDRYIKLVANGTVSELKI